MEKKNLILGFSPWGNGNSIAPFNQIFDKQLDLTNHNVAECDAIIMWGGTDIHPKYYNARANPETYANATIRDKVEWEWMQEAVQRGIPIIGICRGAQFLCALAGGQLIQHVDGHHATHDVICLEDGKITEVYQTSSCHHQMLDLNSDGLEYELLAYTANRSSTYQGEYPDENRKPDVDPEVVYFPSVNGFAIQGHPEWMGNTDPFVQWCLKNIKQRFFEEV